MTDAETPEVRALFDRMETATDVVFGSIIGFTISEGYQDLFSSSDQGERFSSLDKDFVVVAIVTVFCVAIIKTVTFFIRIRRSWTAFGALIAASFGLGVFIRQFGSKTDFSKFGPVENVLVTWLLTAIFLTVIWRVYVAGDDKFSENGS